MYVYFQSLFSLEAADHSRKLYSQPLNGTDSREKPHNLMEYALDHFRLVLTCITYQNYKYVILLDMFVFITFSIWPSLFVMRIVFV